MVLFFLGGGVLTPAGGLVFRARVRARARARVRPAKGPGTAERMSATICPGFSFSWFWREIVLNAFFCPWGPCWLVLWGVFRPGVLLAVWGRCKGFRRAFSGPAGLTKVPGVVCPPCGRIGPDGIGRAGIMC